MQASLFFPIVQLLYSWCVLSLENFLSIYRPTYFQWSLFLKFTHHYFDKDWISMVTCFSQCYTLSFVHSMVLLEKGRDFKRWAPIGDTQVTKYMSSEEEWESGLVCSLSHLLFLLCSLYSSLSSSLKAWHFFCFINCRKAIQPTNFGTKPLKTINKNKYHFFIKWSLSGISQ